MQYLIPTIKEFLSTKLSAIEFVDFEISDKASTDFDTFEICANLPSEQQVAELKTFGIDANKAIVDACCNEIFNCINKVIIDKITNGAVKSYEKVDANGIEQLRETLCIIASDTGDHPNNVIITVPTLSPLCHNEAKINFGQDISLLVKNGIFQFSVEDDINFNAAFYIDYNRYSDPYNAIFVNYNKPIKLDIGKIELTASDDNSQTVRLAYRFDLGDASISKAYINIKA